MIKEKPGTTRRRGWAIPLLLATALAASLWHSNRRLQVVESSFSSTRLPNGFDGFTILQLSDLHGATFGEGNGTLLAEVGEIRPDIIVITGDTVDKLSRRTIDYAIQLCAGLAAISPTYFITGNHEWAFGGAEVKKLLAALREVGVVCLENEAVPLERAGDTIVLAGIHDPNGYADQKTPAETAAEVYAQYGDPFWILLAHRNDRFEDGYSMLGADLTLSGHGHGGMIRLPFTDGLLGVDRSFFPSYTAGYYEANDNWVYVSRGIGNSGSSFRLFNPPELAVIRLKKAYYE